MATWDICQSIAIPGWPDIIAYHQVEQTNSLDEGETQNGVREELTTERWVAGHSQQESAEHETDTNTGTTKADGGGTHTQVLGDLNKGVGHLRGVGALGGDADLRRGGTCGVEEGGCALHGVEGGVLTGGAWYSCMSNMFLLALDGRDDGSYTPEYARLNFWSCWTLVIGRAALMELDAAIEAILGAETRREEAIVETGLVWCGGTSVEWRVVMW